MNANQLVRGLFCVSQTGSADYSYSRHMGSFWTAKRQLHLLFENVTERWELAGRGGRHTGIGDVTAAHPDRCWCPRFRSCESLRRSCSAAPGSPGHSEVSGGRPDRSWRSTRVVLHWEDEQMNHVEDKQRSKTKTMVLYWPVWVWCWQWDPLHLWGQVHLYWLTPSTQVPPFWQGLLAHSLMTVDEEQNDHSSRLSCFHPGDQRDIPWIYCPCSTASVHLKDTPELCKYTIIRYGNGKEKVKWLWSTLWLFVVHVDKKQIGGADVETVERLLFGSSGAEATEHWPPTSPSHVYLTPPGATTGL